MADIEMDYESNRDKKFSRVFAESDELEIVISGMSGKFPNARNVTEYEYNLYNKIDMVDDEERRWRHFNPEIPRRAGKIWDLEKFDATYFGVHFKQAHTMDPQCRLLMETAYEAIIDAGVNPKSLAGTRTGVYMGTCISESEKTWFYEKVPSGGFGITGCSRAMIPNRISYALGLKGPSYVVDTACSSSMYAFDNAFSALRNGEIDAALVGGSNLILHPFVTLQFARLGVLSPQGFCRPFDKNANGYTRSESINCLFLQRKRDAKRIYATVVYSKANCDGYKPEGITYPSGKTQEKLLHEFYFDIERKVRPSDLGYLEAHSTGTFVGDPEECRAIDNVLCAQRQDPLLVGSVKSNIGHSEAASGICSIIKAILAFQNGLVPPNINFTEVKPEIPALVEGRLRVVSDPQPLQKPFIGVNSFGFGGANAHALFKAYEKEKQNLGLSNDTLPRLVVWSGRTHEAVKLILDDVESHPLDAEFIGLLHNIQERGIPGLTARGFGLFSCEGVNNAKCLVSEIQQFTGVNRPIVWVFSGMGSQWSEMGKSLMDIPIFRNSIVRCHETLESKGMDLIRILTSDDESIFDNILNSFVGIAAIQIGLVDILRVLEMEPDFIIGHSVGELGCGYADGGFSAEQMILAAYYRGKVSCDIEKIRGSMAAVGLGNDKIINMLPKEIEVACHNGPDSSTISGPSDIVTKFVAELKRQGIFAKEVPCSNIAYHSRYIAHMGPELLKYLKEIIPNPKERSSKWLSSSVPRHEWSQGGRNLCSAEYHTNNLLSAVLFEETQALLPDNALTLEIAPHGLLQAILKRSMPQGVHIGLTQRKNKSNVNYLLSSLGRLYNSGVDFPISKLYPAVEFPVSRGTRGISSLVKWDHSEDWFITKYENMQTKSSGERLFKLTLQSDNEEFLAGHIIDGKVLVPATAYLQYVWETFSLMYHGPSIVDVPLEFEDIRFLRATHLTKDNTIELVVMIQYGTGHFEITEAGSLVCTGFVREIENPQPPEPIKIPAESNYPMLTQKDFYKELKLRGYHYKGVFRAVNEARGDGLYGKIKWEYNWVTFMDAMLQIHIIGTDARTLLLPTKIRKLRIFGNLIGKMLNEIPSENKEFEVYVSHSEDRVVCGGIEIMGLQASPVGRRKPPGIPILEKYEFLPHFPSPQLSISDACRVFVQLLVENNPSMKINVVEIDDGKHIINNFMEAVEDLPLINGDYTVITNNKDLEMDGINILVDGKLQSCTSCHFIIVSNILGNNQEISNMAKSLVEMGYIVSKENTNTDIKKIIKPDGFHLVTVIPTSDLEVLVLLQKERKRFYGTPVPIEVSLMDVEYSWIEKVRSSLVKGPVILFAQNEKNSGILGLVNCLRKEPDGHMVTCVFIDDPRAPPFDVKNHFYERQLSLGLGINVYRNGMWGTYRHLQLILEDLPLPRSEHVYGNVLNRGDLSSLSWFQGQLEPKDCDIDIVYSSINFRDVMLATGRLAVEIYGTSRLDQGCVLGFEFAGYNKRTGKRVMSMIPKAGIGSHVLKPAPLIWDVPDKWTLKEAATIPVVYVTVYYAFFVSTKINKGQSILIHAGSGGIGLAAIKIALAYGLKVYTTCSTPQKRRFIMDTFPQITDSQIGNSRDTSFERMIQRETNGKGVDFVLNSLSEDKLLASVRCLAQSGHFLEIGKFDMATDNKLGMGLFLKEITFHAVLADSMLFAPETRLKELALMKKLIDKDIERGIVQPLPVTVFAANELEKAFRFLGGGKHIGKVIIQMREDAESPVTLPIKVIPQIYFKSDMIYIIPGGLGGFGLELADWMCLRGARQLMLSSSKGISNSYQRFRISLWTTYGCRVHISTNDITTRPGCELLIRDSKCIAPVGGIFNLAVSLRDAIFNNQDKQKFSESLAPKAIATKHLDEISRKECPKLQHFVVFSSVSCGRGNAGQSNYGMANSIMERIIEDRIANGYPGKAIQWGAVGEVGLVADMAEDKIDMEIGGTLQQRISSCLQELDNLLTVDDPIVGSMVVAEKRVGKTGQENIIETVMNIMGIRDMKSLSLNTTLSEMGMDSLMAVEIKQTLERDFELILTPQDLRSLTFHKLQEYSDAKKNEAGEVVKIMLSSDSLSVGLDFLIRNLGDEDNCHLDFLPLQTISDGGNLSLNTNPKIIIPGLEGVAGQAWYSLGAKLKSKSTVLQLHNTASMISIENIVDYIFRKLLTFIKPQGKFYIVAYSFGTFVALELVRRLEKLGYNGQILLIDGSPFFLKQLTHRHFGENMTEDNLYNILLSNIITSIFPEEKAESLFQIFNSLPNVEEKFVKFKEFTKRQNLYSISYSEIMMKAMANRIKIAHGWDLDKPLLRTPITLVRPSEVAIVNMEEDYTLRKVTKGRIAVKFIEGSHTTMMDNPMLAHIINEFDPALEEDKEFEKYISKK